MKAAIILSIGLISGSALGWLYFQALWATVWRLPQRRRPGLWIVASLFLRLALALGTFVWLSRWGGWPALLAGLLGFITARVVLVRRLGPPILKTKESP